MAARARRDPSTQRGKLKRLRKMANRVAVRAKLIVHGRTKDAGLNTGRTRNLIHLEHAVQMLEVNRNRAAIAIPAGGSTPPTTLEPPPNGAAARFAPSHHSRTRVSSASSRGYAT